MKVSGYNVKVNYKTKDERERSVIVSEKLAAIINRAENGVKLHI